MTNNNCGMTAKKKKQIASLRCGMTTEKKQPIRSTQAGRNRAVEQSV
jgi:hypothetical protein